MTRTLHTELANHLLRDDGGEDICIATFAVSSGARRTTRILNRVHLPQDGDREVHGNATIHGSYVLRVAAQARQLGYGVAILHSHPRGAGWQAMSLADADAESSFASLVEQLTGLPLVGLTLAGDDGWSARVWTDEAPAHAGSVRVVSDTLTVSFNGNVAAPPDPQVSQARTIAAWGDSKQDDIARLRVLVVGAGSVGLDIVQRLAATGLREIGVMDVDRIEEVNLDRMVGATGRDARLRRRKVDVAAKLARRAATSRVFVVNRHHVNVCSPAGLAAALDYDVIFSCVDRPWPRAVLNASAYADLIPVIDGGIAIDTFDSGSMRGSTRRTQSAVPGRPCLACAGQVSMQEVTLEMSGDLDDPEYIRRAGRTAVSGRPNVAALCAGVGASQLEHFVSLVAHPAGIGVPHPLRFLLAAHHLEHVPNETQPFCEAEGRLAAGDSRITLVREPDSSDIDSGSGFSWWRRRLQNAVDDLAEWSVRR